MDRGNADTITYLWVKKCDLLYLCGSNLKATHINDITISSL